MLSTAALVLTAATVSAPAAVAGTCGTRDSGVVDVSQTPTRSEGEESVSIDPLNTGWLISGANEGSSNAGANGANETPAWWSHDGGCSWHRVMPDLGGLNVGSSLGSLGAVGPLAPEFMEVGNVLTADQHSAWDDHGNAYFSDIQVSGLRTADDQIRVAHSTDGGITWGAPVVVFSGESSPPPVGSEYALGQVPLDRPWLAVDRTGGARDGTVYATWETSPFSPGLPPEVFAASSTDNGRSWSRAVRVDDGSYTTQFNPRQFPAVGGDGTLYVMYDMAPVTVTVAPGVQGGTIKLGLATSSDGGRTFSRYVVDPDVHRLDDPDEATPEYSETIGSLAADQRRPGRLAVVWPEALSATNSRVELRTSVDGGRSWSRRIDVADDPASRDDQHDHVAASFAPDGHLYVEWRDRRASDGTYNGAYDVWARQVTLNDDGSSRLGAVVRLTSGPQPATNIGSSNRNGTLSEFLGLATAQGTLVTAFNQVVGSVTDTVFHRISLDAFATPTALPAVRPCSARRSFRFTIRRPRGRHVRITRVSVFVNGRRARFHLVRRRGRVEVRLRSLPAGTVHVRVVVHTSNHRRYVDSRSYATCHPRPGARRRELESLRAFFARRGASEADRAGAR
jgi:hypothetical protein